MSGSSQESGLALEKYPDYIRLIFLFVFLITTRTPLLFAKKQSHSDTKNRFLAIGSSLAIFGTDLVITESRLVYFQTGAIALATFYSGISSDLVVKTGRKFRKLVVVAGALIFFTSLYLHTRKIHYSALPKNIAGELAGDYASKLQNFQNFLVILFIVILFVGLVKTNLGKRIQFGLIVAMLATTFGLYIGDSLSPEIRQRAIDRNGLNREYDDYLITGDAVVESARWIKTHSKSNDVVATNYSLDGNQSVGNLVSISTQRPVLLESIIYEFQRLIISDFDARLSASNQFWSEPNAINAKVLTDMGVDWYLFATTNSHTKPSVLCQENQIWRCEFINDQSVVIKFLDQN